MTIHNAAEDAYFVTLECFRRQPLLARPQLKQMLVDAMLKTKAQFGLHLVAYVVLDDHAHLLFVTPIAADCLAPMNYLRARLTRLWREHDMRLDEAQLWNHGIRSRRLSDPDAVRAHLDYIHYDPVRHGVCERAFDYPWSSLPARVEQGFYPEDWALLGPPASLRRVGARH